MLRKGIYASPRRNNQGIEELLGTSGAFQPALTDEKENGKDDAVANEGATHDEMC